MDKSEKYIKMCKQASEVQELLKCSFDLRSQGYCLKHNCLLDEDYDGCPSCPVFKENIPDDFHKFDAYFDEEMCYSHWIGLPYQDQLQEVLYEGIQQDYRVIADIYDFVKENLEYVKQFSSLEQIWLAFVMKERFNKVWVDEKEAWVDRFV